MADSFVPVTFVADELLTSTKMNLLAANQAGFHDGTALGDGIIVTRHLGPSGSLQLPFTNVAKASIGTSKRLTASNISGGSSGVTAISTTFGFLSGQTYLIHFSSQQSSSSDGGVWYSQLNVDGSSRATSRYSGTSSIQMSAAITDVYTASSSSTLMVSTTLHRASGSGNTTCETPRLMIIPVIN